MKKYDKVLIEIILAVCILILMPSNNCIAMSNISGKSETIKIADKSKPDTVTGGGDTPTTVSGTMKQVTPSYLDSSNYSELQTTIGYILNFLQVASGITAVVMIAFTGFKLIFEVNPEVVNETKRTMYPIVLGIVLTFGATSIAKFIISALE